MQSADIIDYQIHGDVMEILEIELDPGEAVQAEPGSMIFMEDGIEMQTGTGGGFLSGLKRKITGEDFFISKFAHKGKGKSKVGFAGPYPGTIVPINLHEHRGAFICQRDSFLTCANGIKVSIHLNKKIGSGLFGGEGFILQKLEGVGMGFICTGGNVLERDLKAGERLRVETGCVAGFTAGMGFDIEYVGGFLNPIFGGEGLFVSTITGPGTVYIQSMPFQHLVDAIGCAFERSGVKGQHLRK